MIHRHLKVAERQYILVDYRKVSTSDLKESLQKELQVMKGVHAISACDIIVNEQEGTGRVVLSVNTESVEDVVTVLPFTGARVLQCPSPFYPK